MVHSTKRLPRKSCNFFEDRFTGDFMTVYYVRVSSQICASAIFLHITDGRKLKCTQFLVPLVL